MTRVEETRLARADTRELRVDAQALLERSGGGRDWLVPAGAGLLQLLTGLGVVLLGIHYDGLGRMPGPLVWLGISLLPGPWWLYARWQWRRNQTWALERARARRAEARVVKVLRPLVEQRAGHITGLFERINRELEAAEEDPEDGDDG